MMPPAAGGIEMLNPYCCTLQDFSVYTANSPEDLFTKVEQKRSAWCGFQSLLQWDSHTCVTRISPFHDAAVAVVHPPKHGATSVTIVHALPSKSGSAVWQFQFRDPKLSIRQVVVCL